MMFKKCLSKVKANVIGALLMPFMLFACADEVKVSPPSEAVFDSVSEAANGGHRSEEHIARNAFRHPVETLAFFGLQPDMTVVEISPGALWYTEILAPVLKRQGRLVAAAYDAELPSARPYHKRLMTEMLEQFEKQPSVFANVEIAKFTPPNVIELGADDSADMVLTFRNSHGWVHAGSAMKAYQSFFNVLKPGGVLGVVQHRGDNRLLSDDSEKMSGYLSETEIIALATNAGLVLEAKSEINANPNDTKDYEKGVWALPPGLATSWFKRKQNMAIGESDRMTLKFRKPLL